MTRASTPRPCSTDDVDGVLADLDYTQANLVGISYGTTAEQVFLARHPNRVRTMTLLGGTLGGRGAAVFMG